MATAKNSVLSNFVAALARDVHAIHAGVVCKDVTPLKSKKDEHVFLCIELFNKAGEDQLTGKVYGKEAKLYVNETAKSFETFNSLALKKGDKIIVIERAFSTTDESGEERCVTYYSDVFIVERAK